MRLAFMGTPDFSVPVLAALLAAGHEIACVYSQPPRPAGRGQKDQPSPVHRFAAGRGIAVRTPKSLKPAEEQAAFAALNLDAAVVVAYGLILPQAILDTPKLGCFNVHASLLPRWRGAAPIHRAILAGDPETGICIMRMEAGLDTGPVLLRACTPIRPDDTTGRLHDRLADLGAQLMVRALTNLRELNAEPQAETGVTYAAKIAKEEARIDWSKPAAEIDRLVRAMNPSPGAWFEADGQRVKLWQVEVIDPVRSAGTEENIPGVVLDDRLAIACGTGALRPVSLQRAGKGAMGLDEFLRGFDLPAGTRLA